MIVNGFNVGVRLNISVDFRTNSCSGLLFYVASSIYSDHLLVELRDGHVSVPALMLFACIIGSFLCRWC